MDDRETVIARTRSRNVVVPVLVGLAVILVMAVIWVLFKKLNTVTFEDYNLYQYYVGQKIEYTGTVSIAYDGEMTNITYGENKKVLTEASPFYFKEKSNEMLFATDMELVIPRMRKQNYKLNRLTVVSADLDSEDVTAYFSTKKQKKYLEESFVYDGADLYVFPYGATIEIGEEKYELSPLSYINATYKGDVEIYDRQKDEYKIIEECMDTIKTKVAGYDVNLSADMIIYQDGETRLLVKNYTNLPAYQ